MKLRASRATDHFLQKPIEDGIAEDEVASLVLLHHPSSVNRREIQILDIIASNFACEIS